MPATVRSRTFLSKEVREAYKRNDGVALKGFTKNTEESHEKVARAISHPGTVPVWNRTTVDGKVVHFYGDKEAYVWSTVDSAEGEEPQNDLKEAAKEAAAAPQIDGAVVKNVTVEVGFYSASGGQASSLLVDVERIATDTAIGAAIGTLVYAGIGSLISSNLTPAAQQLVANNKVLVKAQKALQAATPETSGALQMAVNNARDVIERDVMAVAVETQGLGYMESILVKYKGWVAGAGALVVVTIATYLFDRYVLPHLMEDFFVKINIVNLDSRAWLVDQWHHANAIVANGAFQTTHLDRPQGRLVPFSDVKADFLEAPNVTYTFQNSFTLMDGLGIALRVVDATQAQDPKTGFAIGYFCPYAKKNQMTIKSGVPAKLSAFYEENSNWPSGYQPMSVSDTLDINGEKVLLQATTDHLEGVDNHIYYCYVTIGKVA